MKKIFLLLLSGLLVAQGWSQVSGRVIDDSNGEALIGASIQLPDEEVIITDENGEFSLPAGTSEVIVSHVGYETTVINVSEVSEPLLISLAAGSFNLQEVVVSAYHTNRKLLDTPGPVAIASRGDIERDQDLILTNTLNRIPGVYQHSGALNTNRITIRGIGSRSRFSTNRVKGYINGIPLTSGDGETILEDIDVSLIDRVEVVRGPASTEYGAALGGVIHLKTEQPNYRRNRIITDTQVGSFGLIRNNSTFDLGFKNGSIKFWASKTVSDGYRENNDYDRQTGAILGQFNITDKTTLSFIFNFIDISASIPSSINDSTFRVNPRAAAPVWLAAEGGEDYERGFIGVSFNHKISKKLNVAYSVFTNFRNAEEVRPFDILNENTNAYGVRFKYQYDLGPQDFLPIITFGTEMFSDNLVATTHNNDSIADFPSFVESHDDVVRNYQNYFVHGDWQFGEKLAVVAGINLNNTKYEFDDFFTTDGDQSGEVNYDLVVSPRIGINYKLNTNMALHGTIGHGFGTPTFEESRDSQGAINPDIEPETGYNFEIGSRGSLMNNRLTYDVSLFTMRIRNLLVSRRIADDQLLGVNAGKTTHNGFEAALGYLFYESKTSFLKSVTGHLNYTLAAYEFDEFIDGDDDFSGNELTGTPRNTVNGIIELGTSVGIYGNINYRYVDEIPILDDNSEFADDFQVVNLKGGYRNQFGIIGINVYGGINNLFDERYASQVLINPQFNRRFFYPGQEINYFAGLALTIDL